MPTYDAVMTADTRDTPSARRTTLTWVVAVALLALPVVWLDVYLLAPREEGAEYVVGRYSLLLGAGSALALVVERVRGQEPWAAFVGALLAWVGVLLGRVLGAGEGLYPWLLVAAAGLAAVAAVGMPGAHRAAALRTAVVLAVVSGVGLLGLA